MERGIAIVGWSVATVGVSVSALALYKWCKLRQYVKSLKDVYRSDNEVKKQLIHHYVDIDELSRLKDIIPSSANNYHGRLAEFCCTMCTLHSVNKHRVLDVGCGVGGTSFHLSKYFGEVVGADISYEMIVAGQQLKQFAEYASPLTSEGGKHIKLYKIRVPEGCDRDRVTFWDQDVCSLLSDSTGFDCVLVSNVLTDLESPKHFLLSIRNCVPAGGLLIISDPFLWRNGPEEPLESDGSLKTIALLERLLKDDWTRVNSETMPYYVAQSESVATVARADIGVWKRNSLADSSD